jgi:hypothetical protein
MMFTSLIVGLLAGVCVQTSPRQADAPPQEQAQQEPKPIERFQHDAAAYDMRLQSEPNVPLKLIEKPLLHWGNPARTGEDGAVFIWESHGRPQVIGSIFTYKIQEVRTKHEFQSLAFEPLVAKFHAQVTWTPQQAGVQFRPIPDAPAPAENGRQRTVQLKALAREFSARMTDLKEGTTDELRLMPNPLYRYEAPSPPVVDGAIFAFAVGTDPEVLLLIEARTHDKGPRWEYAFARSHYVYLRGYLRGEEVWHVEADPAQALLKIGDTAHQGKPYTSYHVE